MQCEIEQSLLRGGVAGQYVVEGEGLSVGAGGEGEQGLLDERVVSRVPVQVRNENSLVGVGKLSEPDA
ncbi:hypothetical protein [Streptomyces luteolus]|uniref:Uncharacterized protein n=1 Tax=Streptomyces luteolus TaxID=3043615 RepID=A0ABT6T5G3_9ACTN|nr:hypothetical protein [Streptomyces sp. B-S-A12]MDI3423086.1 hypothetical protein [Streptomyces sp. B-S-A12]